MARIAGIDLPKNKRGEIGLTYIYGIGRSMSQKIQSRSGYSRKIGFEGGQMPIYRILPKRGFKNINRVEYSAINISTLQMIHEKTNLSEITPDVLIANGLVKKKDLIKILGKGELSCALTVSAHAFSATAKEAIEKNGGSISVIGATAADQQ